MPPRKVTHGFFFVSVRSAGAVEERSLALASCIVGWRTFLGDVFCGLSASADLAVA